jgi:hypothetical protein
MEARNVVMRVDRSPPRAPSPRHPRESARRERPAGNRSATETKPAMRTKAIAVRFTRLAEESLSTSRIATSHAAARPRRPIGIAALPTAGININPRSAATEGRRKK